MVVPFLSTAAGVTGLIWCSEGRLKHRRPVEPRWPLRREQRRFLGDGGTPNIGTLSRGGTEYWTTWLDGGGPLRLPENERTPDRSTFIRRAYRNST